MEEAKTGLCAWCGKSGPAAFHAEVKWKKLASKWYKCESCGSLMMLPIPGEETINEVYDNNYLNSRLQPHAAVDSRIRYSKEYRPTVFSEYQLSLKDLGFVEAHPASILDFGCADGVFLEFCRSHYGEGADLLGVDIAEEMLESARKKGFRAYEFEKMPKFERKFELITLWDVAEHLPDPFAILSLLKPMLAPGGRIVIQTPCFGILGELLKENWSHLLPVQHINIASFEGMKKFAERLHLKIDKHSTFGANAPAGCVQEPFKKTFDSLAKIMNVGITQVVSLYLD